MGQITNKQMRDIFIEEIYKEALKDKNILFLSNEYGAPPLDKFREEMPNQFINMGISEQNSISVASGLAMTGKKIFLYSIASFITLRCLEQIKIDICKMKQPVTIIGVGPCYAYSEDGPTHHATEDIAIIRSLANIKILSPSDMNLAKDMFSEINNASQPTYIRIDRGQLPLLESKKIDIKDGYRKFGSNNRVAIVSTGIMVHKAIEAQKILKEQYMLEVDVIDLFQIKPLTLYFKNDISQYKTLVTVEEHTLNGGIGSIVLEYISDNNCKAKVIRMGIEDHDLYAYGKRDKMHKERRIDIESIVNKVISLKEINEL